MNLDLAPLGWIHTLACLAALALGPWIFATRKGTARHRKLGTIYVWAQVALNLTALGVYRTGHFFFPHVLAIATLALLALGWAAARFHQPRIVWKNIHLSCMILSYYMLIGGGVNEVYLRIDALRAFVNHNGGGVIAQTHAAVLLFFLVLLVGWNIVETVRALIRWSRRRRRTTPLAPVGA